MRPKWTVLYNIVSVDSKWIGTGWEFFDDKRSAENCQDEQNHKGNCATLRLYYKTCDDIHIGATHRDSLEEIQ